MLTDGIKKFNTEKRFIFYQKTRYLAGYIVSLIIRSLLNLNIDGGDTQSGLKGFKKIKNFEDYEFISFKFFLDLEIFYLYRKLNKKFFLSLLNMILMKIHLFKSFRLKILQY